MKIDTHISWVDDILDTWKDVIGNDFPGYKNHVYRIIHFCLALRNCTHDERSKVVIAGCFHDLGIWSGHTFDYLSPSIALAKEYLEQSNLDGWASEIELMIAMHHKVRKTQDEHHPLVEVFRQGDLVDLSLGFVRCGLSKRYIHDVKRFFPNAGFHKRLVQLEVGWFSRHPWNPLPIFKW